MNVERTFHLSDVMLILINCTLDFYWNLLVYYEIIRVETVLIKITAATCSLVFTVCGTCKSGNLRENNFYFAHQ